MTTTPLEPEAIRLDLPEARFAALAFASAYAYVPTGGGLGCVQGRLLCARLKVADEATLAHLTSRVWSQRRNLAMFADVGRGSAILVPVPGSALPGDGCWVGERLAWYLRESGLARAVWPILRRCRPVRKSAFAAAGDRPTVREHYDSFALATGTAPGLELGRHEPLRLVLVDDVITRGRTLLAAAMRLRGAFPEAEVRAFALFRTLGRDEAFRAVFDPCEGEVLWLHGDARRRP